MLYGTNNKKEEEMLNETKGNFTLFTELPDGKIEVDDESGCPTMSISADELAGKVLTFLGDIIGDDLANLTRDYNENINCMRDQHEYILEAQKVNKKQAQQLEEINRENQNASKARVIQRTALESALRDVAEANRKLKIAENQRDKAVSLQAKAEAELLEVKNKLAEQKKKTALAVGQKNAALEGGKWYAHKFAGIMKELDALGLQSVNVTQTCVHAQALMKATGRVVEAVIEAPNSPDLKLAKVPLNVVGAINDINIRLASMGYNVSLKHNYAFVIDDGMKGQQYVFCGANGDLISFNVPTFTKYKNVKNYITEQFAKVTTEDFDALDKDTDFYNCAKTFEGVIVDVVKKIKDITDKATPAPNEACPVAITTMKKRK